MTTITVSTDKNKLDVSFIQNFLKDTYWAKDRTIEVDKVGEIGRKTKTC